MNLLSPQTLVQRTCVVNAKALFITGYSREQSRLKDLNCCHHLFVSIPAFIKHIQNLHNKRTRITDADDPEKQRLRQQVHDLLGVGICNQCSLHIVTNIKNITKWNGIISMNVSKTRSVRLDFYDDIVLMQNYFVNCLQYLQTAICIFKTPYLYTQLFHSFTIMMTDLNHRCRMEKKKRKDLKSLNMRTQLKASTIQTNISYNSIALSLFQFARNIKLIRKKHWKLLLSAHFEYFSVWLEFIKMQLQYELYLEYQWGYECMFCLIVVICFAMQRIKNKRYKNGLKKLIMFVKDNVSHKYDKSMRREYMLIQSFLILEDINQAKTLYESYLVFAKNVYETKRNDMQCQNSKCKIQRRDKNMRKCKGCHVARYCSKKCQKYDWNANMHRMYCNQLKTMRNART
eukprot:410934_1